MFIFFIHKAPTVWYTENFNYYCTRLLKKCTKPTVNTSIKLTMGVADAGGHSLGDSASHHELQEVLRGFLLLVELTPRPPRHQLGLDGLVDHKVNNRLWDAVVGGCDALVEAQETLPQHAMFNFVTDFKNNLLCLDVTDTSSNFNSTLGRCKLAL